jgi:hypothetical protein
LSQSLSYWDALGRWWQGQSLAGMRVWGLEMLWWGRIGKILQFTGGLAAIIDVIGPERIVAWGLQLRERQVEPARRSFAQSWRARWQTFQEYRSHELTTLVQLREPDDGEALLYTMYPELRPVYDEDERWDRLSEDARRATEASGCSFLFGGFTVFGGVVLMLWWQPVVPSPVPWWGMALLIVAGIALAVVVTLVVGMINDALPVIILLARRAWAVMAYYLLVVPAVRVLRGPQPDRSLRAVGVALVVVGFSFDLLAT